MIHFSPPSIPTRVFYKCKVTHSTIYQLSSRQLHDRGQRETKLNAIVIESETPFVASLSSQSDPSQFGDKCLTWSKVSARIRQPTPQHFILADTKTNSSGLCDLEDATTAITDSSRTLASNALILHLRGLSLKLLSRTDTLFE